MSNAHSLDTGIREQETQHRSFINKTPAAIMGNPEPSTKVFKQREQKIKSGTIGMINLQETQEFLRVWSPAPDSLDYYSEKFSEIGTEIKSYWNIAPPTVLSVSLSS